MTACRGRDGQLVAVLPLYMWSGRPLRVARFIGHGPGDALGPVCRSEDGKQSRSRSRARSKTGAFHSSSARTCLPRKAGARFSERRGSSTREALCCLSRAAAGKPCLPLGARTCARRCAPANGSRPTITLNFASPRIGPAGAGSGHALTAHVAPRVRLRARSLSIDVSRHSRSPEGGSGSGCSRSTAKRVPPGTDSLRERRVYYQASRSGDSAWEIRARLRPSRPLHTGGGHRRGRRVPLSTRRRGLQVSVREPRHGLESFVRVRGIPAQAALRVALRLPQPLGAGSARQEPVRLSGR